MVDLISAKRTQKIDQNYKPTWKNNNCFIIQSNLPNSPYTIMFHRKKFSSY